MVYEIDTSRELVGSIESLTGGRSENQDFAGATDAAIGTVIVVCDGMGGMNGGSTASRMAVSNIIDQIVLASEGDDPKKVLDDAIHFANTRILEAGAIDSSLHGMGTTVTAVIVNKDCITAAFVGDSRIYQLRGGKKHFRTFDHSQVFQVMVKNNLMTEEQARVSNESNIILNALGIGESLTVEIHQLPYISGDRFVLCTDGFWGSMPEDDLISLMTRKGKISDVVKHATTSVDVIGASNGGGHDNITAAIFDIKRDSKMKEPMRKSIKICLSALAALLVLSVAFNVITMSKSSNMKATVEKVQDLSAELSMTDSTKEIAEKLQSIVGQKEDAKAKEETVSKKDKAKDSVEEAKADDATNAEPEKDEPKDDADNAKTETESEAKV